jgi:hypothetical protein
MGSGRSCTLLTGEQGTLHNHGLNFGADNGAVALPEYHYGTVDPSRIGGSKLNGVRWC